MTESEMVEAARRIQQEIESARVDFEAQGQAEPLAQAVSAILAGRVIAQGQKIKRLQQDVAALLEILSESEK